MSRTRPPKRRAQTSRPTHDSPEGLWRDAIVRAVLRRRSGHDEATLDRLADRLVDKALEGETTALKELGMWLEGKSNPPPDKTGDSEGDLIRALARIRRARTRDHSAGDGADDAASQRTRQ